MSQDLVQILKSSYDEFAYKDEAFSHAHPYRLAAEAGFAGLEFPPVEHCRVLEIGCAGGGNLIPMAEQMPASRFLGIDLSPRQIESGQRIISEIGLQNVELRNMDLADFPPGAGQFDFIIAHGVYSYLPGAIKDRLLHVCRQHLSPRGIAYISYNVYPGWHLNEIGREIMLAGAAGKSSAKERLAAGRELLQFVSDQATEDGHYREVIRAFASKFLKAADYYVIHEHLEAVNEPVYFRQFAQQLQRHGLSYIGDASADPDCMLKLPLARQEKIRQMARNPLDREQLLDFIVGRTFRSSVITLAERQGELSPSKPGRLDKLYFAGNLLEREIAGGPDQSSTVEFTVSDGRGVRAAKPALIAVLRHIRQAWPAAVSYADLSQVAARHAAVAALSQELRRELDSLLEFCYRLLVLEVWPRSTESIAVRAPEQPVSTRFARWQAARDGKVTSLRHHAIVLDPPFRELFSLLDGSRSREQIVSELARRGSNSQWASIPPPQLQATVDAALDKMASNSLFLSGKE